MLEGIFVGEVGIYFVTIFNDFDVLLMLFQNG